MFVELCLKVSYRALQNAVLPLTQRKTSLQESVTRRKGPLVDSHMQQVLWLQQPCRASLEKLSWESSLSLERLLTGSSQQADYMGNIQWAFAAQVPDISRDTEVITGPFWMKS